MGPALPAGPGLLPEYPAQPQGPADSCSWQMMLVMQTPFSAFPTHVGVAGVLGGPREVAWASLSGGGRYAGLCGQLASGGW